MARNVFLDELKVVYCQNFNYLFTLLESCLEAVTKFKMGNKSGKKKKDPTILTQVL